MSQSFPFNVRLFGSSVSGGNNPIKATEATRVLYILCTGAIGSQAVVLGAIGEEQRWVVWRQHCSTIVPPAVSQVTHQVEEVAPLI